MKTTAKLLSVAAITAVILGASARESQAGTSVSVGFGFGFGGGHGYRHCYGYPSYPVYYTRPVYYYYPPPPPVVVQSVPVAAPVRVSSSAPATGVADVKAMAKAGVSDEVIMSQIRSSRAVYRLTTAEIIDLKDSGVSQRVIDFMINANGS